MSDYNDRIGRKTAAKQRQNSGKKWQKAAKGGFCVKHNVFNCDLTMEPNSSSNNLDIRDYALSDCRPQTLLYECVLTGQKSSSGGVQLETFAIGKKNGQNTLDGERLPASVFMASQRVWLVNVTTEKGATFRGTACIATLIDEEMVFVTAAHVIFDSDDVQKYGKVVQVKVAADLQDMATNPYLVEPTNMQRHATLDIAFFTVKVPQDEQPNLGELDYQPLVEQLTGASGSTGASSATGFVIGFPSKPDADDDLFRATYYDNATDSWKFPNSKDMISESLKDFLSVWSKAFGNYNTKIASSGTLAASFTDENGNERPYYANTTSGMSGGLVLCFDGERVWTCGIHVAYRKAGPMDYCNVYIPFECFYAELEYFTNMQRAN